MRFGEGAATSTAAYEDAMACEMILVIAFVTAADRDQGPQCWGRLAQCRSPRATKDVKRTCAADI
jgi:hypothetical protein